MEHEILAYFQLKGWEFKRQAGEFILKVCPFCQDSKNHFYMCPTSSKFQCHKCQQVGNLFSLKKKMGDLPEEKSLFKPAKTINLKKVEAQRKSLLANQEALTYLQDQRGFSLETIKQFRLGVEGDWISIPFFLAGDCFLIKYRRYKGEGERFKREQGFESGLFISPYQVDNGPAIVTEGEFDAISLTQLEFPNVVSVSVGAGGYKPEWADFFEPFRQIFICFDTDEKGGQGAEKLAERLGRYRC